jgi:hypothetical protein
MSNTRRSLAQLVVASMIAASVIMFAFSVASAHEKRTVGPYTMFVGFLSEPTIVEQPNAVDMRVQQGDGANAKPVTGLAGTLKADVKFGDQTTTVGLEESDENPGEYTGSFIPTAAGPYTFRIYGTIDNMNIDQSFTSGPETFSVVESSASLQFPSKVPAVASVAQTANSAHSAADSARTLGIIGIVVGVLGLIAGVGGLMMARGSRTAVDPTEDREEMGSSAT